MNVGLAIAGLISIALGLGHGALGLVWVLPRVTEDSLPRTPFGPPSLTEGMIRVTWHIVTIFALASGGLLLTLAWAPAPDAKTLLLRWFAAMWIGATAMAFYVARPRPRQLVRMPVPLLWVVVAVLCWQAST
jgi:hypothetical protein